jgi:group I intron endonuclease
MLQTQPGEKVNYNRPGVYLIRCMASGEFYVGSSKNVGQRWHQHRHELRRGVHDNTRLQAAYDQHGPDSFRYNILQWCKPDQLTEVEDLWLGELWDEPGRLNVIRSSTDKGEEFCRTMKEAAIKRAQDPEYRRKYTESMRKLHQNPEYRRKRAAATRKACAKPFTVTFPCGRVDAWATTYEAASAYGVSQASASNYLLGKRTPGNRPASRHLKNTIWTYND